MPKGRSYRPGSRRSDLGKGDAELSEARWAWLRCNLGQVITMVNPTESGDPDIKLLHTTQQSRYALNLTALTELELLAYKKLVDTTIDWALPIVRERDANAAAAFEQGDDRYPRSYRPLPQLIFRKGNEQAHWEELRKRSERTPVVESAPNDPNAGLPSASSEVPDGDAGRHGGEND